MTGLTRDASFSEARPSNSPRSGVRPANECRGGVRPSRLVRVSLLACVAFLFTFVAGCDDSPKGPGNFTVSVEWDAGSPPVGAAVVFVGGTGLGEVSPQGTAMAWSTPRLGEQGIRVVVVDTGTPSVLRFTVPVADLRAGTPTAALLSLAGQDNALLPISGAYRVKVY